MARKKKRKQSVKDVKSSSYGQSSSNEPMASWFTSQLSRRTVGKGLAWTTALAMAGLTIYNFSGDDAPEVSYDSLELQRKEGWNVGSSDKRLNFEGSSSTDSRRRAWGGYDPNYLISIYQPRSPEWQPFFVPTLIQSLSQLSLNTQMRPVVTPQMRDAYDRAEGLRNLISQTPDAGQTLIVSDLPGTQSVALGAAMADTAHLAPVFDNWPHPLGVVRSHETIAAMVYYAHEIEEKRSSLKEGAPALLLLDSNRLANYADQDTQFDNRYLAKLPPADQLKARGVNNVIYLVKDQTQTQELDDLNDDFVEWQKNGINVRMLRLSDFRGYDDQAQTPAAGTSATTTHRHYYYGGSPGAHWLFFSHYGYRSPREVFVPRDGRNIPIPRQTTRPAFDPPGYRPASRPTIFNASKIGGSSNPGGVGKTKPSGFGRTSVRVSNEGRITGTRPGRSGSYGRSGGGWFGG
jgi:hypothetical protein